MQNTDTYLDEDEAQSEEMSDVVMPRVANENSKDRLIQQMVRNMKDQLDNLERLLMSTEEDVADMEGLVRRIRNRSEDEVFSQAAQSRIIEGVFDGENMVGEDGRKYLVPPNYASKSKLVEGDFLRLTIADTGRFIFKQKGPNERQRLIGMLVLDEGQDEWHVVANGHKYKVLPASVSYFKGEAGDDAVILVPRNTPSRWAAVENIIKHEEGGEFAV